MHYETLNPPKKIPEFLLPTIDSLKRLRYEWSDEIPQEIIHGTTEGETGQQRKKHYKVQHNFFGAVNISIANIVDLSNDPDLLSPEFKEEFRRFEAHVSSPEFQKSLTAKEDIDWANNLIDKLFLELGIEKS